MNIGSAARATATPAPLAWSLALTTVLFAVAASLNALNGSADLSSTEPGGAAFSIAVPLMLLGYSVVGALIASKRRENPIGWILCFGPLLLAVSFVAEQYATWALVAEPGSLPAGEHAAWVAEWTAPFGVYPLITFFFLLFPDGRLPSPRWRPVARLSGTAVGALVIGLAFTPGRFTDYERVDNPFGLGGAAGDIAGVVHGAGWGLLTLAILGAAGALIVRFRRARGEERLQLKWVTAAAAFTAFCFTLSSFLWESSAVALVLTVLGLSTIPVAAAVAILRYRLYDIDVVINRTLVYAALTALLAGVYVGSVLLLQLALRPLTAKSDLAIAGSTLAVAALFRPARTRIQGAVDRRFYRRKYDAQRTLEAFSTRLRDEVDLDTLAADLRAVVRRTVEPTHVSVWLTSPRTRRPLR
jgi:hypothetical protein